jgi:hypothetical protein
MRGEMWCEFKCPSKACVRGVGMSRARSYARYVCVHTCTHTCSNIHAHIHAYIHTHIHAYVQACVLLDDLHKRREKRKGIIEYDSEAATK